MGLGEFAFSMQMRDTIDKLVRSAIDSARPKYRYATVVSIDGANHKCSVTYNGETSVVQVNMGSIRPDRPGQRVRVEGIGTDKYITDVIGQGAGVIHNANSNAEVNQIVAASAPSRTNPLFVHMSHGHRGDRLLATHDGTIWSKISSTVVAPAVQGPTLLNSWTPYDNGYGWHSYFKTSADIVVVNGLIKGGANGSVIFNLPVGYRPEKKMMFGVLRDTSQSGRIDVLPNGDVIANNTSAGWTSIEFMFPASNGQVWTPVTYKTGWRNYDLTGDTSWGGIEYTVDKYSRIWFRGLANAPAAPTMVNGVSDVFQMPVGLRPDSYLHMFGPASGGFLSAEVRTDGNFGYKAGSTNHAYFSPMDMMYPIATAAQWESLALVNGAQYGGAFPTSQVCVYDDGIVQLRGLVNAIPATPAAIANIPPGRRPRAGSFIHEVNSNNAPGRIDISNTGNLAVLTYNGGWLSLDGVKYLVGG